MRGLFVYFKIPLCGGCMITLIAYEHHTFMTCLWIPFKSTFFCSFIFTLVKSIPHTFMFGLFVYIKVLSCWGFVITHVTSKPHTFMFCLPMRQCQLVCQEFSWLSTKVLTPQWWKLTRTSWCQNSAGLHSFPSMYDMYRQHRSNANENEDRIQKTTKFKQKFWRKKSF